MHVGAVERTWLEPYARAACLQRHHDPKRIAKRDGSEKRHDPLVVPLPGALEIRKLDFAAPRFGYQLTQVNRIGLKEHAVVPFDAVGLTGRSAVRVPVQLIYDNSGSHPGCHGRSRKVDETAIGFYHPTEWPSRLMATTG